MLSKYFEMKSIYLNAAYMGPMPKKARENVEKSVDRAMDPAFLRFADLPALTDGLRTRFSSVLDGSAEHIAVSTSVSEIVSHVANGIDFKPGEQVLLLEGDYPSMVLPWMLRAERGDIELKRLPLPVFTDPKKLAAEINKKTRFVGCSHVQFNTGRTLPIAEIGRLCRKNGALFLADVSQSLGGLRLAPEIMSEVDILAGVAYKWLLGPYGSAFARFSNESLDQIRRTHAAWLASPKSLAAESLLEYTTETLPGARRFDRGQAPSFLICAALDGALETLIDAGLDNIQDHNAGLVEEFLEGLPQGFELAAPRETLANIVCIKPPIEDAMGLKARLARKKIDVSVREGFVRLAFHAFNTHEHVKAVLKEIV